MEHSGNITFAVIPSSNISLWTSYNGNKIYAYVGLNFVSSSKLGLSFAYFSTVTNISFFTVMQTFILREICQNVELPAQCLHRNVDCGIISLSLSFFPSLTNDLAVGPESCFL